MCFDWPAACCRRRAAGISQWNPRTCKSAGKYAQAVERAGRNVSLVLQRYFDTANRRGVTVERLCVVVDFAPLIGWSYV